MDLNIDDINIQYEVEHLRYFYTKKKTDENENVLKQSYVVNNLDLK